jgi:hypothetical protein
MKINTLKKINPTISMRKRSGLENTASAWTLHLVAPLFTWNPTPTEKESKKGKCHFVQGELFPEQVEDGSLKKLQPLAILES